MRVSGGNVWLSFGAGGQQGGADLFETGVALEEPARHLRLPSEAAEIHNGAGMDQCFCTDVDGIDNRNGTT